MFYIHVHGKPGGSNSSRGSNTIVLIEYLAAVTVFLYYSGQGRPQGLKCGRTTGGERSELEGDDT